MRAILTIIIINDIDYEKTASVAYCRHLLKRLSHGRDLNVLMIKSHCRRNGGLARLLRFNAKLLQRLPETFGWRRAIRTGARFSKAKTLAETMPR